MPTENPDSIERDESVAAAEVEFDATEAFLKDAQTERKDDPEEGLSEGDDEAPEPEAPDAVADPEDPEFDIKVGEETRKAKLSDLKRLYGQEAALTQKSQALAEARANAETIASNASAILTAQTDRAAKVWEPYAKLDYLALSTQMDPKDFAELRTEAATALENLNTLKSTLDGHERVTKERHAVQHRERSEATIKELSDPDKGIKGWGPELYGNLLTYAETQGMPAAVARSIMDAPALRLMHKAMLYDQGKAKTAEVKKVVQKATMSLKPGPKGAGEVDGLKAALRAMKADRGSHDSTAAAFLALGR